MKKGVRALLSVLAFALIVACAYAIVTGVALNDTFYDREYQKLDRADYIGMTHDDLMKATRQLINYMKNDADTINTEVTINGERRLIFNEQEVLHMADVLRLVNGWNLYMYIVFGLSAAALAAVLIFVKERRLYTLSKIYVGGSIIAGVFFGALGLWAAIDFTNFWTTFHLIFFDNNLWLMDSSTCIMINMFPEQFFADIVAVILVFAAALILVPLALAIGCLVRNKRRDARVEG